MDRAIITFHLPTHRDTALKLQGRTTESEATYDRCIGDYLAFLRAEGEKIGYRVQSDQRSYGPVFSLEGRGDNEDKGAQAWLETQPDIWNWMP